MSTSSKQAFWDERYQSNAFAYGEAANSFFAKELSELAPGHLLLPMEGQGRNAIHALQHDWQVLALDQSEVARKNTLDRANHHPSLTYINCDCTSIDFMPNRFDAVGLIYAHVPEQHRAAFHRKILQSLRPTGRLILEAFSKHQLGANSGGPKVSSMLYDTETLISDFEGANILLLEELEVVLDEGSFHQGKAQIVRLVLEK